MTGKPLCADLCVGKPRVTRANVDATEGLVSGVIGTLVQVETKGQGVASVDALKRV